MMGKFTRLIATMFAPASDAPINEVAYNSSTWAQWYNLGVSSVVDGFINYTAPATSKNPFHATTLKPSTNYGFLVNIRTNTIGSIKVVDDGYTFATPWTVSGTGLQKVTKTSMSSISMNRLPFVIPASSGTVEFGDFRAFELPSGSQIATDFTNLTADQLNTKYPFVSL